MLLSILFFIIGFFILIKGADFVISGASSIAKYLNVSEWLIGVVIVGIGTSIPELSINIGSAFFDKPIGVGVILGSDIFNLLCILGIVNFVSPMIMKESWVKIDLPINIFAILLSGLVLFFGEYSGITRPEALILFIAFLIWLIYMVKRKDDDIIQPHYEGSDIAAWYLSAALILIGLLGVFLGSYWIIGGAEKIATLAGLSEGLISLTVVALGTSVPEIAVSMRAAIKGKSNIAVGNILGSNIFDLIGIFGITGLIVKIPTPENFFFDYLFLLISSIVLTLFLFIDKKHSLRRWQGLLLFLAYIVYLILIIIRG